MSRYQHQSIPPPRGMNVSTDPSKLAQDEAQYISRFLPSRHGLVELAPCLQNGRAIGNGTTIQGIAYYRFGDASTNYDRVVAVGSDNNVYMATPTFSESSGVVTLSVGAFTLVGAVGYTWTGNVRAVQYQDELIMCPGGGGRPLRFYFETAVGPTYRARLCGMDIDSAAYTDPTSTTVAGGNKIGVYQYLVCYEDNKGRLSDHHYTAGTVTCAAGGNQTGRVSVTWPSDPQVVACRIFVNLNGDFTTFYQINRNTGGINYTFDDTVADPSISTATVAERVGVNAAPPSCHHVSSWKNRMVFCTDVDTSGGLGTTWPGTGQIYISNDGSPTQASVAGDIGYPTDGIVLQIGARQYNPTAAIDYGTVLCVFNPEGCWLVTGDSSDTFQVQPIHTYGCVAGDSLVRCGDTLVWLGRDGWYAGGTSAQKISAPLDAVMTDDYWSGISVERCKTDAVGFFWNNRYFCSLATKTFCYDFQSNGWSDVGYGAIYSAAMLTQDRGISYNPSVGIGPNRPVIPLIVPSTTARQYVSTFPSTVYTPALADDSSQTPGTQPDTSVTPYVTLRYPDGAEVPRNRMKRLKRLTVWGETVRTGTQDVKITVTNERGNSWTYLGQFGNSALIMGALWMQEFPPDVTGRTFTVKVEWMNSVVTPIRFREFVFEYIPLN